MLVDIALAGALLIGLLTLANLGSMPAGIREFLGVRVTIQNVLLFGVFLFQWHLILRSAGVYAWPGELSLALEVRTIFRAVTLASLFALMFPLISSTHAFGWSIIAQFWILGILALVTVRAIGTAFARMPASRRENVVIVGSGPNAADLFDRLSMASPRNSYNLLGFVESANDEKQPDRGAGRGSVLGPFDKLDTILMREPVDRVLIALPAQSAHSEIQRTITICREAGIESEFLFPFVLNPSPAYFGYGALEDRATIRLRTVNHDSLDLTAKRLIDIVGASIALVVLAPLMLLIALVIKLTSRGPAVFVQWRRGLHKHPFAMFKFRTMVADAEDLQDKLESRNEANGPVFKIRDDPRVTRFGRFLRRTSLDETPQFLNVLLGEMSLVGPRPLPDRDVARFSEAYLMRRFSMKPGITGLWQVTGRANMDFRVWIMQDLRYIDHWSLRLDLEILLKTIPAVLSGRGAA